VRTGSVKDAKKENKEKIDSKAKIFPRISRFLWRENTSLFKTNTDFLWHIFLLFVHRSFWQEVVW